MDGRDLKIPVRISDLIWTVGSRSDGEIRSPHLGFTELTGKDLTSPAAARVGSVMALRWSLVTMYPTTTRRRGRRRRWYGPSAPELPVDVIRCGWS
jgi:hypothetical protein